MENKQINNPTRSELITDFVKSNPEYYIKEFQKIGSKPSFSFSFNIYAGILGPIWFGMRNIWNWALAFLIIETFSVVQIIRGLFGNITKEAVEKIKQVESTIAFRNKQLLVSKCDCRFNLFYFFNSLFSNISKQTSYNLYY